VPERNSFQKQWKQKLKDDAQAKAAATAEAKRTDNPAEVA
jgi:hypothetical protein